MRQKQNGFTLVELAIVILIIGLLIGGVLRGQELIKNAEVSASIADIRSYEAAIATFRDQYGAFPGDIRNAGQRLANCGAGLLCAGGNQAVKGNGIISDAAGGTGASLGTAQSRNDENEVFLFWNHLATAEMINGVSTIVNGTPEIGNGLPNADIGGGFTIGYWTGSGVSGLEARGGWDQLSSGHYLRHSLNGRASSATNVALTPNEAARFDRKMDDGLPGSGTIRAAGAEDCVVDSDGDDSTGGDEVYQESLEIDACALYIAVSR